MKENASFIRLKILSRFPPSEGSFSVESHSVMQPIVQFLASTGAPLLINVYPYFSYIKNRANICLDYALFTASGTVVTDKQMNYQNLFDAMMDTAYSAVEKAGGDNMPIVVSESGWPFVGDDPSITTVANVQTYNQNFVKHVGQGTPKRPGRANEAYVFVMFNEDQKKNEETEKHFGLFYPNQQPIYPISFS